MVTLLGNSFQCDGLGGARVMEGEDKAAGQVGEGLTCEACRGVPLVTNISK